MIHIAQLSSESKHHVRKVIIHLTVERITEENFSIDPSLAVNNLLAVLACYKGFKSTLQLLKGRLNEQVQTTMYQQGQYHSVE